MEHFTQISVNGPLIYFLMSGVRVEPFYINYREWTVNLFFNEWGARGTFLHKLPRMDRKFFLMTVVGHRGAMQNYSTFRGWQYVNERFIGKSNTLLYN